jgi:putative ABC transport system ATP-binding protein
MVELRGIVVRYPSGGGAFTLFDGLDFIVPPARSVGLSGPSGSGKSTLLNICAGLLTPQAGRVVTAGVELSALSPAARDRVRIDLVGYVFQGINLIPALSARDNVEVALRLAGTLGRQARRRRAEALLERVGLADRMHHMPAQLSFGQMQRVGIARAIANRPKLLLADEPTASLEPGLALSIAGLLIDCAREEGAALVLASHDPAILDLMQERVSLPDIARRAGTEARS